jgi:hypothetical protein
MVPGPTSDMFVRPDEPTKNSTNETLEADEILTNKPLGGDGYMVAGSRSQPQDMDDATRTSESDASPESLWTTVRRPQKRLTPAW